MRMDGVISFIFGALIGAGIGAASSYLISEKKFNERFNAEVAKLPKAEPAPVEKPEEVHEETHEVAVELEEVEAAGKKEAESLAGLYKTESEDKPVDYVRYSPASKREERKRAKEKKKELDRNRPYVIDAATFEETFPEFEKHESYLYYIQSHELVDDETGDVIIDINGTVGLENMLSFPPNGTVYIRNETLGEDFRVTRFDGRYSEDL